MLFVEDVICILAFRLRTDGKIARLMQTDWLRDFILTTEARVLRGEPLTTEQARIVLKLARRAGRRLNTLGDLAPGSLRALSAEPCYRRPPLASPNIPREVRHLGGDKLAFRFKTNRIITDTFNRLAYGRPEAPYFDRDHRLWVVTLTPHTVAAVQSVIHQHRFGLDAAASGCLAACAAAWNAPPA